VFIGIGLSKAVQERANSKFQRQATSHSSRLGRTTTDVQDSKDKETKEHKAFPSITLGSRVQDETAVMEDLGKVIANLDRVAARAYAKLFNKSLFSEQANLCTTALVSEQAPNPDSRITLSTERDRLGAHLSSSTEPNRQVHYSAIAADNCPRV